MPTTRSGTEWDGTISPPKRRCRFRDSPPPEESPKSVFERRLNELQDILQCRRQLFEIGIQGKLRRVRVLQEPYPLLTIDYLPYSERTFRACHNHKARPSRPALLHRLKRRRPAFWGLTPHGIEMLLRGEVLDWGYKASTGRFLPNEIHKLIMDYMFEDTGIVPGWFTAACNASPRKST